MGTLYRQGDIILERIAKLPKEVTFKSFKLSMSGETGNPHMLEAKVYTRVGTRTTTPLQEFIEVGQGGALMIHPEHQSMLVPAGLYEVRRVRTYTPERPRAVVD